MEYKCISEQIQGTTGIMLQMPKVLKDIVFTCVVLHNMQRTQRGGADKTPTPGNDVVVLRNEQMVYVPDDNYKNPLR